MIKLYLKAFLIVFTFICGSLFPFHLSASENSLTSNPKSQSSLTEETLNDILLAEFSNNSKDYQYALTLYLKQAKLTHDVEIAKRATRIAQHLRDLAALTESAEIWSKAAPEDIEPHQLLANILISEGKFQQALPHFNKALEKGENKVLLSLSSQANLMNHNEAKAYIKLLNTVRAQKEKLNNEFSITLGVLNNKINEYALALGHFNDALEKSPDSPTAIFQKTVTLKNLNRFGDALQSLQPLLDSKQTNQQYSAMQIQLLFLLKRHSDAVNKINVLLEKYYNNYPLYQYLALVAFDYKAYEKSQEILEHLLKINPSKSTPYFYLGLISEQNKQKDDALQHYLKVKDRNLVLQAQTQAIELHKNKDDKNKVINLVNRFIASNTSQATNYTLLLARWLNNNNFTQEALTTLNKQLVKTPQNTQLIYAHAMYVEPIDFSASEKDFKQLLEIEPNNAVYLNAYGYTLTIHTDRYEEALILIEKALEIEPNDPATIDSIGWVKYKMQQYPEAVKYLSKAYDLYPDAEVAFHLIAALLGVNDIEKAKALFEKLSTNTPNNQFVEKARKLLENE